MAKRNTDEAALNMTPMIDVVFQLIIFFILTLKMNQEINKDIILEDAPFGPIIKNDEGAANEKTLTIEVGEKGRISIHNTTQSLGQLQRLLRDRMRKYNGNFPVMIRADYRASHENVRRVMDLCAQEGLWRINFIAVQEHKYTAGRHLGPKQNR